MIEKVKADYEIEHYIETSAKSGFNATETFVTAAKVLYASNQKLKNSGDANQRSFSTFSNRQNVNLQELKTSKSCCG